MFVVHALFAAYNIYNQLLLLLLVPRGLGLVWLYCFVYYRLFSFILLEQLRGVIQSMIS